MIYDGTALLSCLQADTPRQPRGDVKSDFRYIADTFPDSSLRLLQQNWSETAYTKRPTIG